MRAWPELPKGWQWRLGSTLMLALAAAVVVAVLTKGWWGVFAGWFVVALVLMLWDPIRHRLRRKRSANVVPLTASIQATAHVAAVATRSGPPIPHWRQILWRVIFGAPQ
jgi:uncharacterized membrane protein YjjP (DUF1212 family)